MCTQCLEHNRPCDWPEQLKRYVPGPRGWFTCPEYSSTRHYRGPAKGYIEVLENRLHETETVLLKVLSQIPDAQLASTLARDQSNRSDGYSPFPRLGKRGIDYWRRFPLDTAGNIRKWQQDCSSQERPDPMDRETDTVQPDSSINTTDSCRGSSLESEARNPALEVAASRPLHLQQDGGPSQQLRGRKRSATQAAAAAASSSHRSPNQRQTDHQNTSQEPASSWTGAPPVQFQERFLW